MSSGAVANATAATQHEQDDLTLTISPVVFHKSEYIQLDWPSVTLACC